MFFIFSLVFQVLFCAVALVTYASAGFLGGGGGGGGGDYGGGHDHGHGGGDDGGQVQVIIIFAIVLRKFLVILWLYSRNENQYTI